MEDIEEVGVQAASEGNMDSHTHVHTTQKDYTFEMHMSAKMKWMAQLVFNDRGAINDRRVRYNLMFLEVPRLWRWEVMKNLGQQRC